MSNDDGFAPPPPEDTSESGLGGLAEEPSSDAPASGGSETPEATGPDPLEPTQAMPSEETGAPGTPPLDSTQVMPTEPVTPRSTPVQSGEGIPPIVPGAAAGAAGAAVPPPTGGVPLEEEFPEDPWYKNPRVVAGIVLGLVVLGLIILLFVLLGGDDNEGAIDDASDEPVTLVVIRTNSGGGPVSSELSATVTTPTPSPDDYRWIEPADAVVGRSALLDTDATGRAEFRWGPVEETSDWSTTVDLVQAVEPEGDQAVSGIGATCELTRDGSSETLVVATDVAFDETSDSLTGIGSYSFPNQTFVPGDRIACAMVNQIGAPAPTTIAETTTIPEATSTVAETTTTVAETTTTTTTVAPTTAAPTTAAPTTAAPTTAAPTTAAPTTAAPTEPSVADFLTDNNLTSFRDLLIQVGVLTEIENSAQPFTLFAADDQAVSDFLSTFDPTTMNLTDVVRAHVSSQGALDSSDTSSSIDVEFGGPQPLDFAGNPPTVGAAEITDVDNAVEEDSPGFVHVIDAMLEPQP